MTATQLSKRDCLRRAAELEWLAENCPSAAAAAEAWAKARTVRSLALVAADEPPEDGQPQPKG